MSLSSCSLTTILKFTVEILKRGCNSAALPSVTFPEFSGKRAVVVLEQGGDHRIDFVVTSDPSLETGGVPLLSKLTGSLRENNVYVDGQSIIFRRVGRRDSGAYTLSSFNAAGEGKASFTLKCESNLIVFVNTVSLV